MEVSFDVKITPGVLYDYLLYHTYTAGTTGLLETCLSALLVAAYFMAGSILCLIFGVSGASIFPGHYLSGQKKAVSCKSCI